MQSSLEINSCSKTYFVSQGVNRPLRFAVNLRALHGQRAFCGIMAILRTFWADDTGAAATRHGSIAASIIEAVE
jgi:hypothetical protein